MRTSLRSSLRAVIYKSLSFHPHFSLTTLDSVDADGNLRCPFNEEQIKHLREVFIMFDADKSDTISRRGIPGDEYRD